MIILFITVRWIWDVYDGVGLLAIWNKLQFWTNSFLIKGIDFCFNFKFFSLLICRAIASLNLLSSNKIAFRSLTTYSSYDICGRESKRYCHSSNMTLLGAIHAQNPVRLGTFSDSEDGARKLENKQICNKRSSFRSSGELCVNRDSRTSY